MRFYPAVIFSVLVVTASSVVSAPLPSPRDPQLVPRFGVPSAEEAGFAIGSVLRKLPITGPVVKTYLAKVGLNSVTTEFYARRIAAMDLGRLTDEVIQYIFKSTQHDSSTLLLLKETRTKAVDEVSRGVGSLDQIRLLRALGKDGDMEAVNAIKTIFWTPEEVKALDLGGILGMSRISLAKSAAAGAGAALAGGAAVAGGMVAAAMLKDEGFDTSQYPSISNGAISESDQRQILAAMDQRPEDYLTMMDQIRKLNGITPAEIVLFENANPTKDNQEVA